MTASFPASTAAPLPEGTVAAPSQEALQSARNSGKTYEKGGGGQKRGIGLSYIDPGTASYFFQVATGLFFGAMASVAAYWRKIRAWAARLISRSS
ncbi:MAG: hypothetical protein ACYDDF_14625 [Thermoplasmatota archaeon]